MSNLATVVSEVLPEVEAEVIKLLKDIPAEFSAAAIQAIPREIEAGIYAGFAKFQTYFELLQWAVKTENAGALQLVVSIGAEWLAEVQNVTQHVSGSSIIKAFENSSTLFEKSRQMLDAALPQIKAMGYGFPNPVTKAVVSVANIAPVVKEPVVATAPVAEVPVFFGADETPSA